VVAGAAALGVGAALHGFGLVAVAFLVVVTVAYEWGDVPKLTTRLAQVVGAASFGWLVWIPVYLVGLGWSVVADHAAVRPIRPLFHTIRAEHSYDYAVFSHIGLRDIFFEFVILGVLASAVVFLLPPDRLRQAIVVATVPIVLFVIFFWPVQGLGNDTDNLGAIFPALYGVAWLTSRFGRLSSILVAALAVGQLALVYVVHGTEFVHARDF
jgi:hypothetical protein